MELNKYDIDTKVDGIAEKQRYSAVEKATIVLALQGRKETAMNLVKQDCLEAISDILATAELSNSTDVVKFVNTLRTKLTKILG